MNLDLSKKLFCSLAGLSIILLIMNGCAVSPITGERELILFSDSQEIELGKNADADIKWQFGGVYNDPQISEYVDTVGQRVAKVSHRPEIPYHFTVVDSSVVNAFALPGGYIYITRGLLAKLDNEAQLASVLGHEIGHVTARHGIKRLQYTLGFNVLLGVIDHVVASGNENYQKWRGLIKTTSSVAFATVALGYSRKDEFQADELGTLYSFKAGYNPEGMIQLLNTLKSLHEQEPSSVEEFFMSHPRTSSRIEEVEDQISKFDTEQQDGLKKSKYKSQIESLMLVNKAYEHYDKAEVYRKKGQYPQALEEYKKSLQIKNLAKPHYGIGLVYHAQGKYNMAIVEYKKAVNIDSNYYAYNHMGMAYIETGDYNNAISNLKKAIKIYENFDDAHANLGEAYYKLKQNSEAIESLELAIALNENHPRVHTTLGLVYEAVGNTEKAIEEYEKAITVAPKDNYTNIARQRLTQIK